MGNTCTLALLDKWLYAVSKGTFRILQLERNLSTANFDYCNSLLMPIHEDCAVEIVIHKLPNGNGNVGRQAAGANEAVSSYRENLNMAKKLARDDPRVVANVVKGWVGTNG